MLMSTRDH